jgi:hypothetical protein
MKQQRSAKSRSTQKVEGEGSYTATRAYNKHLATALADERSIEKGKQKARRAVEGAEGAELRAAEAKGKAGPRAGSKRPQARAR